MLLGRNAYGSERIDTDYIVNELIALKIKEELLNGAVSPNYQDYNVISEKRASLTGQLPPETRVGLESIVNNFVNDFNTGTLIENAGNGGFQQTVEPAVTAMPNPIPDVSVPVVLENIPPEISGQVGGYEPAESLPNITGTPAHEGHWSDNLVYAVPPKDKELIDFALDTAMGGSPVIDRSGTNEISHYPNGNIDDAEKLFDSLPLTDVRPISSNYGDWGKIGTLPDGTQVKFRPSQDGRPTIEIYDNNRAKPHPVKEIRFGGK